jgi:hypothetical protein
MPDGVIVTLAPCFPDRQQCGAHAQGFEDAER